MYIIAIDKGQKFPHAKLKLLARLSMQIFTENVILCQNKFITDDFFFTATLELFLNDL